MAADESSAAGLVVGEEYLVDVASAVKDVDDEHCVRARLIDNAIRPEDTLSERVISTNAQQWKALRVVEQAVARRP